MSKSPKIGMLELDRFTLIWLAFVGILIAAALTTALVKTDPGTNNLIPTYSMGDSVEDFVFNAYVAHLLGDLPRLQSMYAEDAWDGMPDEDKNWRGSSLFVDSNLQGLRILDTTEEIDGQLQVRVAYYFTRQDGPLSIRRLEVSTRLISLVPTPAGNSWKIQQILPRYWY